MMSDWYEKTDRALQLTGKGDKTRQCYVRAVRLLAGFYDKTPDKITEQELQDYFLHRQNVSKWAPSTMRISYYGIRFFFQNVARRDWHTLDILKVKMKKGFLIFSALRRSEAHLPRSGCSTTMPFFPLSIPVGSGYRKGCIFR